MINSDLRIAVIGYGYWGPNLVRNFNGLEGVEVAYVLDLREERLQVVQKSYPTVKVTTNYEDILKDTSVDAIAISTPVYTHYNLAKAGLNAGKHVLIEKPMTSTSDQAKELIELAAKNNLLLMVDHTYLYTGAVRKIKSLVADNELGNINYIDSVRINLGLFQSDINVLWDLAPHDLSIIQYVTNAQPVSVNATGVCHTNNNIENIAYLTINYDSSLIVHVTSSWSSPVKIRHMLIGGDKKMIVFNDLEPTEKVKVYDSGYNVRTDEEKRDLLIDYRHGDVYSPKISQREALFGMAKDFVSCIIEKETPDSHAELGLVVVKVLEAANESLKQNGKEIKLT
jgi:predicted dehydrogenase